MTAGRSITIENNEAVATIVINRPAVANAIDLSMLEEIDAALAAIELDISARCIVFTGQGSVFSAGGDIAEMRRLSVSEGEAFVATGQSLLDRISASHLVVIAALNGHTLGGGLELALACDIRIADARAKIGFPEVGLGLIPGWGGTQRAARLVGYSRACLFILTGERLGATAAAALGLVDRVVDPGTALLEAKQLAGRIAVNSPSAISASKRALAAALRRGYDDGLREERDAWRSAFATNDRVEGLTAFLEKRAPRWTNS